MEKVYVYIVLGSRSFSTGKICIVELPSTGSSELITTYRDLAKEKACDKMGLNKNDISILDWKYLGDDVTFIN